MPFLEFPCPTLPHPAVDPDRASQGLPALRPPLSPAQGASTGKQGQGQEREAPWMPPLTYLDHSPCGHPAHVGSPPLSLPVCLSHSLGSHVPSPPPFSPRWDSSSCASPTCGCPRPKHTCVPLQHGNCTSCEKKKMFGSCPRVCDVHSQPIQVHFQ